MLLKQVNINKIAAFTAAIEIRIYYTTAKYAYTLGIETLFFFFFNTCNFSSILLPIKFAYRLITSFFSITSFCRGNNIIKSKTIISRKIYKKKIIYSPYQGKEKYIQYNTPNYTKLFSKIVFEMHFLISNKKKKN